MAEAGIEPVGLAGDAVDLARLTGLRDLVGDAPFRLLMGKFMADLSGRLERLAALAAVGDLAMLAGEAHRLRGTVGSYGLSAVSAIALRLETACAAADPAEAAALVSTLRAASEASTARIIERFAIEPG